MTEVRDETLAIHLLDASEEELAYARGMADSLVRELGRLKVQRLVAEELERREALAARTSSLEFLRKMHDQLRAEAARTGGPLDDDGPCADPVCPKPHNPLGGHSAGAAGPLAEDDGEHLVATDPGFPPAFDARAESGINQPNGTPVVAPREFPRTDAEKLRLLADLFDVWDDASPVVAGGTEVQDDLRRIADELEDRDRPRGLTQVGTVRIGRLGKPKADIHAGRAVIVGDELYVLRDV